MVQTVGLDARAWLDEWGTPFSDEAKITERWRKVDANTVQMTITVDDPRTVRETMDERPADAAAAAEGIAQRRDTRSDLRAGGREGVQRTRS